jgi:predicted nucleic acid-binding protein
LILVDSSVWVDFFRATVTPETSRLKSLLGTHPIAIGDLVLAEVLQGFPSDRDFHSTKRLMGSLLVIDLCGSELAVKAARNFRLLRSRGVRVRSTIDTIIATRCIADDIPLLYSDRDFDPFVKHLGLRSALES